MDNLQTVSAKNRGVNLKAHELYTHPVLPKLVKIRVHNERIWCETTDEPYYLKVVNDMVDKYKKIGDIIKIGKDRVIYDIE